MNIFVLDNDIERCAQAHCDQHVGKMILESVQILCTALHLNGIEAPYRPTHSHHPCVRWAAESAENFRWLAALAEALNREFCWRHARTRDHASIAVLRAIEDRDRLLPERGLTPFAQAMPERYKHPTDPVAAYRAFYCGEKAAFARWTRRAPPDWFQPACAESAV